MKTLIAALLVTSGFACAGPGKGHPVPADRALMHSAPAAAAAQQEFDTLPAAIGEKFLQASLTPASLKALAMVPTPQDPTTKYALAGGPKNDDAKMALPLVLKSTTGPVTDEEIKGLDQYLLAYPLPRANIKNYHFRRLYVPAMLEWTYERTKNPALVVCAIRMAYSTAAHRNDRFGAEDILGQGPLPLWPHYRDSSWQNGKLSLSAGIADTAAIAWLTTPARLIARHPELWDKTLDGVTYKHIAFDLIREAFKTTDFVMKDFRQPASQLLICPDYWISEPKNEVPQWNRVFPFMSGTIPLIEALEAFHIEPARAAMLDQTNGAMIDFFWSKVRKIEANGKTVYVYPYGVARLKDNPDQVEDFGHGGFDGRCLETFHHCGRYNFSSEQAQHLADTIALCCHAPGIFSSRLDGGAPPRSKKSKKLEKYTYLDGLEGMIWYAAYRPEIHRNLVDYFFSDWKGKLDSGPVWEILKLRELTDSAQRHQ